MLRIVLVSLAAATVCATAQAPERQAAAVCVDYTAKYIQSAKQAPRCWTDATPEVDSGPRIGGDWPNLPPELTGLRLSAPRATFKLCVREDGTVEKVLKLLSSGESAVDDFYCRELGRWRYQPKKVHGSATRTTQLVTVTFRR